MFGKQKKWSRRDKSSYYMSMEDHGTNGEQLQYELTARYNIEHLRIELERTVKAIEMG